MKNEWVMVGNLKQYNFVNGYQNLLTFTILDNSNYTAMNSHTFTLDEFINAAIKDDDHLKKVMMEGNSYFKATQILNG